MKIYNPLCLLAIGLLFTTYSQADIQIGSLDWGDTVDRNSAFVTYRKDYDSDSVIRGISASIDHSKSGKQKIYISPYDLGHNDKCNTYTYDTTTMTFNGQAIKMDKFCSNFADSNNTYYYYTPSTEKGHQFVVDLFKTSKAPIKLTFNGNTVYMPVKGFTRMWNSAGGNAI